MSAAVNFLSSELNVMEMSGHVLWSTQRITNKILPLTGGIFNSCRFKNGNDYAGITSSLVKWHLSVSSVIFFCSTEYKLHFLMWPLKAAHNLSS